MDANAGSASDDLVVRAAQGSREALETLLKRHTAALRRALAGQIPRSCQVLLSLDDVLQQTFLCVAMHIREVHSHSGRSFAAWLKRIAQRNLRDGVRMLQAQKRGGNGRRTGGAGGDERPSAAGGDGRRRSAAGGDGSLHGDARGQEDDGGDGDGRYEQPTERRGEQAWDRPRPSNGRDTGSFLHALAARGSTPGRHLSREESCELVQSAVARLPLQYRLVIELYDLEQKPMAEVAQIIGKSHGGVYMLRARALDLLAERLGTSWALQEVSSKIRVSDALRWRLSVI